MRQYLNDGWQFAEEFSDALLSPEAPAGLTNVRLPHTVRETPLHYFDEHIYQMRSGYRRTLEIPADWEGKRLFLTFEGVAHSAVVYCNGEIAGEHRCGYTAFTIELTGRVKYGESNLLVVAVDSREDQNLPPFGHVIDYMTFGGIYRDVYLEVRPETYIADVFARGEGDGYLRSVVRLDGPGVEGGTLRLRQRIYPKGESGAQPRDDRRFIADAPLLGLHLEVPMPRLWDVNSPSLYTLVTELLSGGEVLDRVEQNVGFRDSEFRSDGYYLNGRKLKLRGLNRHQSYPYAGYAMPDSMQRLDAEILKRELGCNAVRTSHYPQSHAFLDRCDELGLLVFTEIPGWQHIGDADWKAQALKNVEDMVKQYRNHPSVILWGVRINESQDDDALYALTNRLARRLDPSRPTGGVRYLKQSSFLEDVYTFNDFSHNGGNDGCLKKSAVSPDLYRAYLISEYNGHMFPTKSFDSENHRTEHALRHAKVLDAVAGEADIAGSFGWCMFDYNTHKDFGSGDRVCYHGVLDMFRNPKTAAWVYACQQEETPVLELSGAMDIGEKPEGVLGDVYIFTNAESVRMYRNDVLIREYRRTESPYRNLAHGPILIDDYVGDQLKAEENMPELQRSLLRDVLNCAARRGPANLTAGAQAEAATLSVLFGMGTEEVIRMYRKYVGDWGGDAAGYRFEAVKNGEVVAEKRAAPVVTPRLLVHASDTVLREGKSYDVTALRVRVCDEHGTTLPFWNAPLSVSVEGPLELIGPKTLIPVAGGMGGAYLRTTGAAGEATVRVAFPPEWGGLEGVSLRFTIKKAE